MGPVFSAEDSSSLSQADRPPLHRYHMLLDTALERAEIELSNGVGKS